MSRLKEVRTTAEEEIRLEDFRDAVDAEKIRIRARKSFWRNVRLKLFPFTIKRIKTHE